MKMGPIMKVINARGCVWVSGRERGTERKKDETENRDNGKRCADLTDESPL